MKKRTLDPSEFNAMPLIEAVATSIACAIKALLIQRGFEDVKAFIAHDCNGTPFVTVYGGSKYFTFLIIDD